MAATEISPVARDTRFELFRDYVKTILNLCGGALILSITFLQDRPVPGQRLLGLSLLRASWAALLVSFISSLVYLFFLTLVTKSTDSRLHAGKVKWSAIMSFLGFACGLALFVWFGWVNLP